MYSLELKKLSDGDFVLWLNKKSLEGGHIPFSAWSRLDKLISKGVCTPKIVNGYFMVEFGRIYL